MLQRCRVTLTPALGCRDGRACDRLALKNRLKQGARPRPCEHRAASPPITAALTYRSLCSGLSASLGFALLPLGGRSASALPASARSLTLGLGLGGGHTTRERTPASRRDSRPHQRRQTDHGQLPPETVHRPQVCVPVPAQRLPGG